MPRWSGFGGQVIDHVRVDRARGHLAAERIATDLARLALPLIDRHGARDSLIGIGVAMVGVVRLSDGLVRLAPNLGWQEVPLGELLAQRLKLGLPVMVANEADLGALAEHRRGAAVGIDDVLYLSGEVGVGGGLIVDGQPLIGAAGYAGEVGHMPVNPDGATCRCGSVGCWETEVGERALLRRAGRPASRRPCRRRRGDRVRRSRVGKGAGRAVGDRGVAGHRPGRPGEPVQPDPGRARWRVRSNGALRGRPRSRKPSIGVRSVLRGTSCGWSRPRSAVRPR